MLPHWIREGYIRDDVARDHQQRHPGSQECLRTGSPAVVGMMTYTDIRTTTGTSLLLVGSVVWVGPLPPLIAHQSGSLYWKLGETAGLKPSEMEVSIYEYLGSLHGQRVVGVSPFVDPSGDGGTAVVVYVFDDNMIMPWTVEGFAVVDQEQSMSNAQQAILEALTTVVGGIMRQSFAVDETGAEQTTQDSQHTENEGSYSTSLN